MQWAKKQTGFTIVELLIVVVVIAVLAAIVAVAYNGITGRARSAAVSSETNQYQKKIEIYKSANNDVYPATFEDAGIEIGSVDASYTTSLNSKGYCVATTDATTSYYATQDTPPLPGDCVTTWDIAAWWPMNGDLRDMSGNRYTGVGTNVAMAAGQGGAANTAADFNGTNSSMSCSDSGALAFDNNLTLSVWVWLDAYSSDISGIINYGSGGYWLGIRSTGVVMFYTSTGALDTTTPTIPLNQWTHIVATYASGSRKIYINGVQAASDAFSGFIANYSTFTCRLGNIKGTSTRYLDGRLDDVRIYNRVINAGQIQELYDAGAL